MCISMKKKVIGISCGEKTDSFLPLQYVPTDYIEAVKKAGGVPILLPFGDKEAIEDALQLVDGVIITGGADVNPLMYGEMWHITQGEADSARDIFDIQLITSAVEREIPILGICRGCQIINVALGGTLYQDNMEAGSHVGVHVQKNRKAFASHMINIDKDSFLYEVCGEKYPVNSFHHQSVKEPGNGIKVVATAPDGIVEAIQHESKFIWACQFHPEMMHEKDAKMQEIFNRFIKKVN